MTILSGRTIDFRGGGAPPTVVFLHDEESSTPALLDDLAEIGTVLAPVHPGFADQPRPGWVKSVRDIADVDLDLLDGAGDDLILVGSSFGGWVATEIALRIPDRVAALVLVGPLGLHVDGSQVADHWFRTAEERAALLYADPSKAPRVELMESVASDESMARYGWNPRFSDRTLAPRLRRLSVPVHLIWGEYDEFVPAAFAEAWASLLTGSTTLRAPGSGHFPVYEAPDVVLDAVRGVLAPTR